MSVPVDGNYTLVKFSVSQAAEIKSSSTRHQALLLELDNRHSLCLMAN